jgi:hypothetical protein
MRERDELLVGLYDELVTDALQSIVDRLEAASRAQLDPLHPAEASSRLAEHVGCVVSIVLESLNDDERTTTGLAIVQDVIELLATRSPEALDDLRLTSPATLLSTVERRLPDGFYQSIPRPLTALRDPEQLPPTSRRASLDRRHLAGGVPRPERSRADRHLCRVTYVVGPSPSGGVPPAGP